MRTQEYDLKSVELPRLAGRMFRIFTALLENPITSGPVAARLLEDGGVLRLRTQSYTEPPTYQPPIHSQDEDVIVRGLEELSGQQTPPAAGFHFPRARDYADAYRSGLTTPDEVARRVLAAIEASNSRQPALRAMIAWREKELIQAAQASTQRWLDNAPLSELDGVPVAVKDELDMVPFATTAGTRFLGNRPALTDAHVVAKLRAAGALLIGKTNMHEIGIGVTGLNPYLGTARNPYDPSRHTGGSSSGSAAAVAAGLSPLAVGADGGGSVRIPAAICGVVGLKPTFGRVSESGAAPLNWSLAHIGPLAATAQDVALGYWVMAGPDPQDPNTHFQPPASLEGFNRLDLSDLKLGIYWPWFRHASPEVVQTCEVLLQKMQAQGACMVDVIIPELDAARVAHLITITSEMLSALHPYLEEHRQDLALETRVDFALASYFTSADYVQAQRVRTRLIHHLESVLEQVDVLVTPTTGVTAPPVRLDAQPDGESDLSLLTEIMRFVTPFNLSGHPAITFPAGYDGQGLPVGLQAIGRRWHEHTLLRLAHAAEHLVERRSPQVFYNLLSD